MQLSWKFGQMQARMGWGSGFLNSPAASSEMSFLGMTLHSTFSSMKPLQSWLPSTGHHHSIRLPLALQSILTHQTHLTFSTRSEPLMLITQSSCLCHDPQHSGACRTYFPWPRTRCVNPGSILGEKRTIPNVAPKVGIWTTMPHVCAPSLFRFKFDIIYP